MQRTTRHVTRWRHCMPPYRTRLSEGIFNYPKVAGSDGNLIHTSVTGGLSPKSLHPINILEGCINLSVHRQFQSTAESTISWLILCYFGGNGRQQHTIGACVEDEEQQNASPTISKGPHDVQSAQEGKTNVSPVSSNIGTEVQTENRVGKCLTISQVSLDDFQSLEDSKGTHAVNNVPKDRAEQVTDGNWIQSGQSKADPALVMRMCFILEQNGWGPRTEEKLQQFVEKITSEVVTSVVIQQRNAKLALGFLEWAGKQARYEHRAEPFTKVIGRMGKDKDFATAWNVLESMKKHGLEVNYAFGVFIHRLKRAHMVQGVIKAMNSMRDLNVTPTLHLYTLALKLVLKENYLGEAQRLYLQMLQSGLLPDKTLYGVLISGFGRAGKLDEALHFFEEMKAQGFAPESFMYTSLIRSYSMAGKYDEGQKLYKEMIQNDCWPEVFTDHELTCALHGKNTMEQIGFFLQDVDTKAHVLSIFTYNNMLKYLLDAGKLCEAVDLFHMLSGKPQGVDENSQNLIIRGVKLNLDTYTLLIFGLCKAEKVVEALNIFEEMLARGLSPTNAICNILLLCLSNAGLVDKAFEICDHILKLKVSVSAVAQRGFFSAVRASGYLLKGLKVFETMKWKGCIDQDSNFSLLTGNGVL